MKNFYRYLKNFITAQYHLNLIEWGYYYPLTLKFLTETFQQENSSLSIKIIEAYILKVCDKFESYTKKFGPVTHINSIKF